MKNLVCIKTYNNRTEAEFAKTALEESNIEAIISADDCGGMRPHLLLGTGGVRLLVKGEDEQKALHALEGTLADTE